ncbi:MAG TPA: VOC family protein [Candidatus Baltobacteraceae bacterium]|jgi:PhnB protein|nr:VOC family protein [Candidatus Baltobacteraceae bacterium]
MSTTGTATTGKTGTTTILQPYIFLYGRCKEALEFYRDVFGGSYEAMTVGDSPYKDDAEMGDNDRIMHASFTSPGLSFFCSDGRDNKTIDPEEGNVSLALSFTDKAEGERIVARLSEGGTVKMPLSDAFWGGRFANVIDRFGNDWMITTP